MCVLHLGCEVRGGEVGLDVFYHRGGSVVMIAMPICRSGGGRGFDFLFMAVCMGVGVRCASSKGDLDDSLACQDYCFKGRFMRKRV